MVELVAVELAPEVVVGLGFEGDELTIEDDALIPENNELAVESCERPPLVTGKTALLKDTDMTASVDEAAVDEAEPIDPESVTSDAEATLTLDDISEDDAAVLRDKVDDKASQSP